MDSNVLQSEQAPLSGVAEEVFDQDGFLELVAERPTELTYELCIKAVKADPYNLQSVPVGYHTYRLACMAVEVCGYTLEYVPQRFKTFDVCLLAVIQQGWMLQCVPKRFRNFKMCLEAVKSNGMALAFVPEKFFGPILGPTKGKQLCKEACKRDGGALQVVPPHLIDLNLCHIAMEARGSLKYVPMEWRSYDLCALAVQKFASNLEYVPRQVLLEDLAKGEKILQSAARDIEVFGWVMNNEFKTPGVCMAAVRANSESLPLVPRDRQHLFDPAPIPF